MLDAATLGAFAANDKQRRESWIVDTSATGSGAGSLEEFNAAVKSAKQQPRDIKAIGVIPILGTIVQRGNMFTEASGTASTDVLSKQFDQLMANEQVGTILG